MPANFLAERSREVTSSLELQVTPLQEHHCLRVTIELKSQSLRFEDGSCREVFREMSARSWRERADESAAIEVVRLKNRRAMEGFFFIVAAVMADGGVGF